MTSNRQSYPRFIGQGLECNVIRFRACRCRSLIDRQTADGQMWQDVTSDHDSTGHVHRRTTCWQCSHKRLEQRVDEGTGIWIDSIVACQNASSAVTSHYEETVSAVSLTIYSITYLLRSPHSSEPRASRRRLRVTYLIPGCKSTCLYRWAR